LENGAFEQIEFSSLRRMMESGSISNAVSNRCGYESRRRDINNMRGQRLLAVFAHPDDETFGAGGTLALYAQRGVEVHLVCATRGEVGEAPPDLKGFPSVAEMRESELRCAAKVLGLAGIHFLGYRDSGMPGSPDNDHPQAFAAAPLQDVARAVARYIRELRPQVVITFDPIGGYRHPDHIAAHRATVEAFAMAANSGKDPEGREPYAPQKLYFHTFPHGSLRWAVRILKWLGKDPRHFGKNRDIDITSFAEVDYPIHAKIDIRPVVRLKQEASACHFSQGGGQMAGVMAWFTRLIGGVEMYMRASPQPPPEKIERDLFAGVDARR
jgi:N-acetyl-1-D-myo-inositol-2-amino-2-deoxy-alpha-D-glucopyranoside deacetylase